MWFQNDVRRVLKLQNCERVGRVNGAIFSQLSRVIRTIEMTPHFFFSQFEIGMDRDFYAAESVKTILVRILVNSIYVTPFQTTKRVFWDDYMFFHC